jgi:pimeloyl-ACP methyl ester carboxylesterase
MRSPAESNPAPASRADAATRAIVSSICGWLLLSIGLGIGAPRWGMPVSGILAAISLGCGAGLLVIAVVSIVRATRGWSRLVLVPWFLVLLVLTYALSITLAAVHPPHPALDAVTPEGADVVEMVTDDGVALEGWYFPSRNGAAVVLRHGAGSTRADALAHAEALAEAGYGVLVADARGHGGSSGRGMDLGWYGELDTRAAVDLLAARPDVEAARIRAVVAEGATGRTAADKQWLSEEYGAAGVVQGLLDRVTYGLIDALTPVAPPRSLAGAVAESGTTPILVIAGGDVADERFVAERLRAVAPGRVDVWVVPASGHISALTTVPAEWRGRVVAFLDAALRDESAG